MPDEHDNTKADPPKTSLHAYKDAREEDIKGNADKLLHGDDPKDFQSSEIEDPDETGPPEKH